MVSPDRKTVPLSRGGGVPGTTMPFTAQQLLRILPGAGPVGGTFLPEEKVMRTSQKGVSLTKSFEVSG